MMASYGAMPVGYCALRGLNGLEFRTVREQVKFKKWLLAFITGFAEMAAHTGGRDSWFLGLSRP